MSDEQWKAAEGELEAVATAFGSAVSRLVQTGTIHYEPSAFKHRDTVKDLEEEILDAIVYLAFLYYKVLEWKETLNASSFDSANSADGAVRPPNNVPSLFDAPSGEE